MVFSTVSFSRFTPSRIWTKFMLKHFIWFCYFLGVLASLVLVGTCYRPPNREKIKVALGTSGSD